MVKLGTQCPEQKSPIGFGVSEWLCEIRSLVGQGGSRNSSKVDWHRLSLDHQSTQVSPILLKVGVPTIAEAPHAYLGPPLVTIPVWPWCPSPSIHRSWKMATRPKLLESPQVQALEMQCASLNSSSDGVCHLKWGPGHLPSKPHVAQRLQW